VRKRWSPGRAAAWGIPVGVIAAVQAVRELLALPKGSPLAAQMLGAVFGSLISGSVFFWLVAVIRNWAVGASK
jgi:hypothetical protein